MTSNAYVVFLVYSYY